MLKITKFGGSSVANATQFKKVKAIVQADPSRKYVVVSAPGKRNSSDNKITDLLYLLDAHRQYHVDASNVYRLIRQRFVDIKTELGLKQPIEKELDTFYTNLNTYTQAQIVSRGEYFCAKLMAEYLGYDFVDAKDIIRFNLDKTIDMQATAAKLQAKCAQYEHFVFPGFYGSSANNQIQVFSRGGGDITGSILAKCLNADMYENWTDVSGFLMADPKIVDHPKQITHITYSELRELSYMGASVLHEEAIFPVKEANIPIHILNTNHPEDPGTIIQERTNVKNPYAITGIAGKEGFVSIYIYKKHMSSEVGYIRKVLSILEMYNVSVEHIPSGIDSFSVVVNKSDVQDSLYEILARIKTELKPDEIHTEENLALISTVGKSMSDSPGVAGKLFKSLGDQKINIRMIAQSSDEINITVAVLCKDFKATIRSIYDAFVTKEDQNV
ncbi:MAG: aspartate kinase [Erysipelotrichaceae bacterium]|uniref:aspartate kinase n=1 Tax=Faecalicoccus TaxID=1573536 RepID=UPI00195FA701|nr:MULTISPECIES: aspartate kinase [Faecalicoccus]MBE6119021.1 aspartate kinase [Erysipelotrichaceae bacterium]MBM6678885.1 aspartate kinase [Faecalicoccus pleomorphus]MCI6379302.1 aspartate kinase [Erysipelotrichaceae bacterium]MDY4277487.1 aspartate kinase [Faecalicoccus sp.]MDY4869133.1 aspartate kinase [Faecalicoccus sp.]